MADQGDGGNTPSASDSLSKPIVVPRPAAGAAAVLLGNLFAAMNGSGDDANERYQAALKDLRGSVDLVVVEIARGEKSCDSRDYPGRWAHVHAACELQHRGALPFLRSIVLRPIPPEESTDPHSFSTVAEETILRTTAVEGVGVLARGNAAPALDALFEFLSVDSLSVRRAAVQCLLHTPRGRRLRKRIENALPESQRFLLNLRPMDVRDVEQIKRPQRHLRSGLDRKVEAPPGLPERDVSQKKPRGRSPKTKE